MWSHFIRGFWQFSNLSQFLSKADVKVKNVNHQHAILPYFVLCFRNIKGQTKDKFSAYSCIILPKQNGNIMIFCPLSSHNNYNSSIYTVYRFLCNKYYPFIQHYSISPKLSQSRNRTQIYFHLLKN